MRFYGFLKPKNTSFVQPNSTALIFVRYGTKFKLVTCALYTNVSIEGMLNFSNPDWGIHAPPISLATRRDATETDQ